MPDRFHLPLARLPAVLLPLLALLPVLAVSAPRFMGYAPGLLGLGGMIYMLAAARREIRFSAAPYICAGTILALAAASALWSDHPAFVLERSGKMALVLLPGLLLYTVLRNLPGDVWAGHRFLPALPLGLFAACLLVIAELLGGMPLYKLLNGIPYGEHLDDFHMNRSTVIVTLLFFPALQILEFSGLKDGARKYGAYAMWAAMIALQLVTESQSAQMGFIFGAIFYLLFPHGRPLAWHGLRGAVAALLAAAPWLAIVLFSQLAAHVDGMPWLKNAYAANRLEIWDFISRYALLSPWIGHGIEATRLVEHFDTAMLYHDKDTILHPHNFALQIWIEFGAAGAAAAIAFTGYVLYRIERLPRGSMRAALPPVISALSIGATGYGLWQGWWLGSFMLLLAWWALADSAARGKQDAQ